MIKIEKNMNKVCLLIIKHSNAYFIYIFVRVKFNLQFHLLDQMYFHHCMLCIENRLHLKKYEISLLKHKT